jgi:hypothetical protein
MIPMDVPVKYPSAPFGLNVNSMMAQIDEGIFLRFACPAGPPSVDISVSAVPSHPRVCLVGYVTYVVSESMIKILMYTVNPSASYMSM